MVKTVRHSPTKTKEHLETYTNSHIYKKFYQMKTVSITVWWLFFYFGRYIKKVPIKDKGTHLHKIVRPRLKKTNKIDVRLCI